jgi:nucleoside-diphosphate-sugar epimerase
MLLFVTGATGWIGLGVGNDVIADGYQALGLARYS